MKRGRLRDEQTTPPRELCIKKGATKVCEKQHEEEKKMTMLLLECPCLTTFSCCTNLLAHLSRFLNGDKLHVGVVDQMIDGRKEGSGVCSEKTELCSGETP